MEEKRPGQYFDITETDKGTYILNANDLCMAEHIKELADAGVYSLKIEGRAKSHYYVAVATNAYRGAVDAYYSGAEKTPEWVMKELDKISHRAYSTGFYYGRPENAQTYENGMVLATLKNKFLRGQELDCLEAGSEPFTVNTDELYNQKGELIDSAPHPMMTIKIPFERPIKPGSLLRMKAE